MTRSLDVLLYGRKVGGVSQATATGRLAFSYDVDWAKDGPGIPLSISLPLTAIEHGHDRIAPYMWGLLPDNPDVRKAVAAGLPGRVSSENPFSMLREIGEDCAGAVQFVRPERISELAGEDGVIWLEESDIAEMLSRARRRLPPVQKVRAKGGRYSLSGAQPKVALHRIRTGSSDRWGLPMGRTPTTHILKPPMAGLGGQLENEHFCLSLAAALGMRAARSEVIRFGDEVAIVSERFDRLPRADGTYSRVHQEDMCQALAVMPSKKYQCDGGPGPEKIVRDVLRNSAAPQESVHEDVRSFLQAIAYNWMVLGADAHAKNFSVIHSRNMAYRLAPLYDINSALPYDDTRDVAMSFKVGGYYRFDIFPRHWERLARGCGFPADEMVSIVMEMLEKTPDIAARVAAQCRDQGLCHSVVDVVPEMMTARCKAMAVAYRSDGRPVSGSADDKHSRSEGVEASTLPTLG